MIRSVLRSIVPVLALFGLSVGAACGGGGEPGPTPTSTPLPTLGPIELTPESPVATPSVSLDIAATEPLATFLAVGKGSAQTGTASLAAGDFNGDGVQDLVIGAPLADGPDGSREDAGSAYVVYGSEGLKGTLDLGSDDVDFVVYGARSGDNLGFGLAAGDLNDDGIDDLIIGAPASDGLPPVRTDAGEVYVMFGSADMRGSLDIADKQHDFTFIAAEGFARAGSSLAAGDINADGIDDLVIGAPFAGRKPGVPVGGPRSSVGEVYVVFGSPSFGGSVAVASDEQDLTLTGDEEFDSFGHAVRVADLNNDGIGDIMTTAANSDGPENDRSDAGQAFAFAGSAGLSGKAATSDAFLSIYAADGGDALGELLASGDFNGDGVADVLISARQADGPNNIRDVSGEAYLFFGSPDLAGVVDLAKDAPDALIYGPDSGDLIGASPVVADIDGDGLDDIILGAPFAASAGNGRRFGGEVYVIAGSALSEVLDLRFNLDGVTVIYGGEARDEFGAALAVGDFNADGAAEVAIMAPEAAGPDRRAGEVLLVATPR